MKERELGAEPFWTIDEELCELELQERPGGPERYSVRLKAREERSAYRGQGETIYPLVHDGEVTELTGSAYILVPDITLTVGLYPHERAGGAIGEVTDSQWDGMRHHEIARVRGLCYQEDHALALWEVDDWNRLDEFALGQLWQGFECWLMLRYPEATRIFTDDSEPGESIEDNQEFLRSLGYQPVEGTHRIFAKALSTRHP